MGGDSDQHFLKRGDFIKKVEDPWTRSRKFIIGVNEVVELISADELDSSNNNLIDEKDVIFLEEAMSESDDTITVTIDVTVNGVEVADYRKVKCRSTRFRLRQIKRK